MGRKRPPKLGDAVLVEWVDIYEQCHDDPARAQIKRFRTLTYFLGWRGKGKANRQLVCTSTIDCDTGEYYGCCSYPAGCVLSVTVL